MPHGLCSDLAHLTQICASRESCAKLKWSRMLPPADVGSHSTPLTVVIVAACLQLAVRALACAPKQGLPLQVVREALDTATGEVLALAGTNQIVADWASVNCAFNVPRYEGAPGTAQETSCDTVLLQRLGVCLCDA